MQHELNWETEPQNKSLIWRDGNNSRGLDWKDADISYSICTIGNRSFNLVKQLDANQCGPASIINTLTILGESAPTISQIRNTIPQTLRGTTNHNNKDTFWLYISSIKHYLDEKLGEDRVDQMYSTLDDDDFKNSTAIIVNTGNHFVSFVLMDSIWYRIDSLNPGESSPKVTQITGDFIKQTLHKKSFISIKKSASQSRLDWR